MSAPKPDLSEFQAISQAHPPVCVIARSRARLRGRDRANFDQALTLTNDEGGYVIGHETVSKWLKGKGLAGRSDAVRTHREGGCCCAQA